MPPPLYAVKNVGKVFLPGGFQALSGINLDIHAGECSLVAGSNGSGKTLLMRILAGLLDPTEGEVLFCGKPLSKSLRQLRRGVGLIFQDADAQFVGETAAEDVAFGPANLGFSREEIAARVEAALAARDMGANKDFPPPPAFGGGKTAARGGGGSCDGLPHGDSGRTFRQP
jgi:energy-coupling factor transporter ATP-binding protein EcfA2